jgi:hypothetical protein
MRLKMGDIVSIKHYSGFEIFNSIVLDSDGDIVTIKTTDNFSELNIFVNDPIVVGFSYKTEVFICECIITKINTNNQLTEIKILSEKKVTDNRIHERFPVSLFAEIITNNIKKPKTILIKNISLSGVMVISKENFSTSDIINLTIFIENTIFKAKGEIVRKMEHSYSFEYGIKLIYDNINSKNIIEKYILYLKKEQLHTLEKLKNKFS